MSDKLRAAIEARAKERKTPVNPKAMVTFAQESSEWTEFVPSEDESEENEESAMAMVTVHKDTGDAESESNASKEMATEWEDWRNEQGEALYALVHRTVPDLAGKIVGTFLLSLTDDELTELRGSESKLEMRIAEAIEVITEEALEAAQRTKTEREDRSDGPEDESPQTSDDELSPTIFGEPLPMPPMMNNRDDFNASPTGVDDARLEIDAWRAMMHEELRYPKSSSEDEDEEEEWPVTTGANGQ